MFAVAGARDDGAGRAARRPERASSSRTSPCALILLVLYARVYRAPRGRTTGRRLVHPHVRPRRRVWLVSLAVPGRWKYVVWGLALALEHVAPIRAWRLLRGVPVDPRHVPERFGLLIDHRPRRVRDRRRARDRRGELDARLGRGRVRAASSRRPRSGGSTSTSSTRRSVVDARTCAAGSRSSTRTTSSRRASPRSGSGVKLAILSVEPGSRYDDIGWIAAAGTALSMVGLAAIQLVTPPDARRRRRRPAARRPPPSPAVLAALATVLSPVVILWLLAAALVAQVVVELAAHERHTGQLAGPI